MSKDRPLTTERIQALADCANRSCMGCPSGDLCGGASVRLAQELMEARTTIDTLRSSAGSQSG